MLILHHPFRHPDELLKDHIDWAAAYQSDCLNKRVTVCVPPLHLHMDSLPDTVKDKDDEDVESDSESIPDEDHEADNFRAEWMQEAGRHPNQRVVAFSRTSNYFRTLIPARPLGVGEPPRGR